MKKRFSPDRGAAALLVAFLAVPPALPDAAAAQAGARDGTTARVAVAEENFRAIPRGTVAAELVRGATLRLGETRDRWQQATLEAWIWAASVREQRNGEHDLVVSAADGENLRATPNGTLIGRARPRMRLERLETQGDWIRVRRTAWIWRPSLEAVGAEAAPSGAADGRGAAPVARASADRDDARPAPAAARPPTAGPPTAGAAGAAGGRPSGSTGEGEREFSTTGAEGLAVLNAPAGDTVARVQPATTLEVLAREGDWTRVRVEGWVVTGALTSDTADGGVIRDGTIAELQADPERARGRLVEWTIQFIALQHAERFRTDFLEGEPFILARGPGEDAGFVYIAVPPEREAEVRELTPLERVRVLGRVRTVRSRLTDAPVLDLLRIVRR